MVALLTGGVPDLKFDCCVIQTDGLSQEGSCGHNGRAVINTGGTPTTCFVKRA